MTGFIETLANHSFLQNAFFGGILASIGCGVMGSYVVVNRIGYLAGGIAHSVLGGMGIAYFIGRSPVGGALLAALIAAALIGWINLRWRQHEDTIIGALWAIGMAIGVLFISQTPGYNVDLMSYLFGNILMISGDQLVLIAVLDGAILLVVLLFHRQLLAISFDEEFASLRGVHVGATYLLLLCLVAITVVILIQVVGLILVIALLTLPAAIARQYVRSLGSMMLIATVLGMFFTSGGLMLSYEPDLPAGATMILLAGLSYFVSLTLTGFVRRRWLSRDQSQ